LSVEDEFDVIWIWLFSFLIFAFFTVTAWFIFVGELRELYWLVKVGRRLLVDGRVDDVEFGDFGIAKSN
tara:strand:+ start:90 stop:296 length:207 start_codon:yes stop_codon:yes gene_type:complete